MDYVDDHEDYDTVDRHSPVDTDGVDAYKLQFCNWPEHNGSLVDTMEDPSRH